jgi:hypothetical protein
MNSYEKDTFLIVDQLVYERTNNMTMLGGKTCCILICDRCTSYDEI